MPEEEVLSKEELLNQLKADVNTKFTVAMLETKLLEYTGATTFARMNKPALVDLLASFLAAEDPMKSLLEAAPSFVLCHQPMNQQRPSAPQVDKYLQNRQQRAPPYLA